MQSAIEPGCGIRLHIRHAPTHGRVGHRHSPLLPALTRVILDEMDTHRGARPPRADCPSVSTPTDILVLNGTLEKVQLRIIGVDRLAI